MTKDNPCEHDLMGVLHCKKCGEQYHTDWLDALKQVKLEAVGEVLERVQSTIKMKSKSGPNQEEAREIAINAINEVKDVYEEIITSKSFMEKGKEFPN